MARRPTPTLDTINTDRLRLFFEGYAKESGLRVRSRRKALGLTLDDLGKLIGCPMQTISKVENGEIVPRDYLKAAIALRLAVEMAELWPHPTREMLAREAA